MVQPMWAWTSHHHIPQPASQLCTRPCIRTQPPLPRLPSWCPTSGAGQRPAEALWFLLRELFFLLCDLTPQVWCLCSLCLAWGGTGISAGAPRAALLVAPPAIPSEIALFLLLLSCFMRVFALPKSVPNHILQPLSTGEVPTLSPGAHKDTPCTNS